MAIGQHRSPRFTEATPLHMGLGAHVLVLCLAGHVLIVGRVSCVDHVGCLASIGTTSDHVPRLSHADRLCMCQLFHTSHVPDGLSEAVGGLRGPL